MSYRALSPLALVLQLAAAVELTKASWDEMTAGKRVFIKFFAPWCGHCKRLKPAWDQLMEAYAGHESILVAEVDCTSAGAKKLCDEEGVEGFPTLRFGDPLALEDYNGFRDFEALDSFTKANLCPSCSPERMDLCDELTRKRIEEWMEMPMSELKYKIRKKEEEVTAAEKDLKGFVKQLEKKYDDAVQAQEAKQKAIKEGGLSMMKAVQAHNRRLQRAANGAAQSTAKPAKRTPSRSEL
mmetsp:Transcript_67341/g.147555  ORF Transcript_67341/g.147555 Transcript_67341/m.147555 type:complete len:239 (+) Transcript_67341:34-750(+)